MGKWLQIKDAAEYSDVSPRTLRVWLKRGLKHSHISQKLILVHSDDIDNYIGKFAENYNQENLIDTVVNECVGEMV